MQTSPMSLLRGSVLAAAISGAFAVAGCEKADWGEPRERDPNATTMRMTGPDGEEVVAEIVETKNGMRMRIEGNGGGTNHRDGAARRLSEARRRYRTR